MGLLRLLSQGILMDKDLIASAAEGGAGAIIRGGVAKGQDLGQNETWRKFDEAKLISFARMRKAALRSCYALL